MPSSPDPSLPGRVRTRRFLLVGLIYAGLLALGWFAADWFTDIARQELSPLTRGMITTAVAIAMLAFVILSALPFVPGVEIGIGLLMLFGTRVALLVYCGMVSALLLAYLVGRFLPARYVASVFHYLGFRRAHKLVHDLEQCNRADRIAFLMQKAPNRWVPFLLRNRYLALIIVLNLPGNALIGGGGGIGFAAGMSGLMHFPGYLIAVLIAVAPVPLIYALM